MDQAELAVNVMEFFDDLRDHRVPEIDDVIIVVRDVDGVVAYRTTTSDTQVNLDMLARAIGIETGYLPS